MMAMPHVARMGHSPSRSGHMTSPVPNLTAKVAAKSATTRRADAKSSSPQTALRILCFGDSNTAGFPPGKVPYGKHLEGILNKQGYSCRVTICGHSGLTAKELSARRNDPAIRDVTGVCRPGLACMLERERFDLALIMLGTNGLPTQGEEEILHHIEALHKMCHARNIPTMAFAAVTIDRARAPPGLRRKRLELSLELDKLEDTDPMVLGFVDPRTQVPRNSQFWEPDGLHFSSVGLARFAQSVAPAVMDAIDLMRRPAGYPAPPRRASSVPPVPQAETILSLKRISAMGVPPRANSASKRPVQSVPVPGVRGWSPGARHQNIPIAASLGRVF